MNDESPLRPQTPEEREEMARNMQLDFLASVKRIALVAEDERRHWRRMRIVLAWMFLVMSAVFTAAYYATGQWADVFNAVFWAINSGLSFYGLHRFPAKWSD